MKKLLLLSSLCFIISSFGYTSEDIFNANYLGDQGIVTKQTTASKYRLDDKILRQEVIGMALKVKGITLPENYTCKKYFADAIKNDWVCRAVELAADNGIISRSNKYANPGKSVTRAEALAMVMKAGGFIDTLSQDQLDTLEYWRMHFDTDISWHQDIILQGFFYDIIDTQKYISDSGVSGSEGATGNSTTLEVKFSPNRLATRAEVFGFAKNIVGQYYLTHMTGNSKYEITYSSDIYTNLTENSEGNPMLEFGEPRNDLNGKIYSYIDIKLHTDTIDTLSNVSKVLGTKMINGVQYVIVEYYDMMTVRTYLVFSDFYDFEFVNSTIDDISMLRFKKDQHMLSNIHVLKLYYHLLTQDTKEDKIQAGNLANGLFKAYNMRVPTGVSGATFYDWYKNTESVTFRENTLKSLGDNTYEFLVDMTESGVKSTYKVKSKVNLEKFTIDNISSVKQ